MGKTRNSQLKALILFVILAFSYLWCILDNVVSSAETAKAGVVMPITAVTIASGFFWLIAHGIHGTAAIALPFLILRHGTTQSKKVTHE